MEVMEPTVIISGDFNFPFVTWKRSIGGACNWKMKKDTNRKKDDKKQFNTLMEIIDNYNLMQIIEEPTREKNSLDLGFAQIDVTRTIMSDHIIS